MPRRPGTSGRILIVDDDALERTADADVIVSDLVMPGMDGFELLRHLQEHGDLSPTIAITGIGSMEKALSAVHDLKAFWYLEKPGS